MLLKIIYHPRNVAAMVRKAQCERIKLSKVVPTAYLIILICIINIIEAAQMRNEKPRHCVGVSAGHGAYHHRIFLCHSLLEMKLRASGARAGSSLRGAEAPARRNFMAGSSQAATQAMLANIASSAALPSIVLSAEASINNRPS